MKNIIYLILLCNILFANIDYLTIYKEKGINEVERILKEELKKTQNGQIGYFESIRYVVLIVKKEKTLKVYDTKKDKIIFESSVFVGKETGCKEREGDLKTPTGVYKLTKVLTKLDAFYGPLALVTNYPNEFDKSLNNTGDGIWIHGVPNDDTRKPYTKGCIALDNLNLKKLNNTINISNTIVIISENRQITISKEQLNTIFTQLSLWKKAWKNNDLETYLSFYSKDFKRTNGWDINRFAKYKKRIFNKNETKTIIFSKINIIPYPNELGKIMFRIIMDENYKAKFYKFIGKKELYIELIDNKMQILIE